MKDLEIWVVYTLVCDDLSDYWEQYSIPVTYDVAVDMAKQRKQHGRHVRIMVEAHNILPEGELE